MSSTHGSCLCGDVHWTADGPLASMTHCHCSRCRKAHGTNFATYVMCGAGQFRLDRGADQIERYASSAAWARPFCRRCGSVVADGTENFGMIGIPAGLFDDDPGVRPLAHIFVASKAPWHDILDDLPRFDAFPPGFDVPEVPTGPLAGSPTDGPRGSCLCGGVAWVMPGTPLWCRHCHCSRCRKQRGAAHASNVVVGPDGVRFTAGGDLVASYKVPEAKFFTHAFCRVCGSSVPRIDPDRRIGIVPMGSFDDDPGVRPQHHIWVGSKAPWHEILDDLAQYAEGPPPT